MAVSTSKLRAALAAGLLSLAGCETAFVGDAPSGRYELLRVEGRALPFTRMASGCTETVSGGHLTLDSIARRFEMEVARSSSCTGAAPVRETGTYLRRGGTLTLETEGAQPRSLTAYESGRTVSLEAGGLSLRFTRPATR